MHVYDLIGYINYVGNIDSAVMVPNMQKMTRAELCQLAKQKKCNDAKHFEDYMIFFCTFWINFSKKKNNKIHAWKNLYKNKKTIHSTMVVHEKRL